MNWNIHEVGDAISRTIVFLCEHSMGMTAVANGPFWGTSLCALLASSPKDKYRCGPTPYCTLSYPGSTLMSKTAEIVHHRLQSGVRAICSHAEAPIRAMTLVLAAGLAAVAGEARGQASEMDPDVLVEQAEVASDAEFGFRAGSFFAAPVPRSTPTLGNSLYLLGGYIFSADASSRTSVLGVGTMLNENGSEMTAIGGRLSLFSRRLQLRFAYGKGSLNYDAFVGSLAVPVNQEATGVFLSAGYGVSETLTLGIAGRYTESLIKPDAGVLPPGFPVQDIELDTGRVGLFAEYETTDNDVFPREGWRVNVAADRGDSSETGEFSIITGLADYFVPFQERDALAMRLSLCSSTEDTPYFIECSLGRTDKFRGFEFFRFGGEAMASFQAEYRGRFANRFGYSVYAGIGAAGDGFNELSDAGWQSAAGIGARYQLTKRFPLDFGIDVTVNSEEETNVYVSIGQGF